MKESKGWLKSTVSKEGLKSTVTRGGLKSPVFNKEKRMVAVHDMNIKVSKRLCI
jgi:hypothetical protein